MVTRIFYVAFALAIICFFVDTRHKGEAFSIGIYDLDDAIRTGVDKLGGASLISDDKSVMILESRAFETHSAGHHGVPDMIEFMWRP